MHKQALLKVVCGMGTVVNAPKIIRDSRVPLSYYTLFRAMMGMYHDENSLTDI